jgi:hypothetical protein
MSEQEKIIIQDRLLAFLEEMNKWEQFCNEVERDDSLTFYEQSAKQQEAIHKIFDEYCTKKERKYGRPTTISYSIEDSDDCDIIEEKITNIEEKDSKNKVIVLTEQNDSLNSKYQYLLVKNKGIWLVDSKKRYSNWKKKWVIESL